MSPRYLVANIKDGVAPPPGSVRTYTQCADCGTDVYWTLPEGVSAPAWVKPGVVVCGACAREHYRRGDVDL